MKNLAIITSKSITFNRFLLEISDSLSNKFEVTLCCKDSENINNLKKLNKENIAFPDSFIELVDLRKTFKVIKQINKIISNSDLIYLHTPLASHFVRLVYFFHFMKLKIIYHIHGLRYIPDKWNFEGIIYRFLEFIFLLKQINLLQ